MQVYLEIGKQRTFAGAMDWPGWCRSGKDEVLALQAFLDHGPRYLRAVQSAGVRIELPQDVSDLSIVERLPGNSGTDFGAPNVAPAIDSGPVSQAELQRFQALLKAFWRSFDDAVQAAEGKELRKGPRGGGRDLERIIHHVLEADLAYLDRLGGKFKQAEKPTDPRQAFEPLHQAILSTLEASVRGEIQPLGPRGGRRWTPRFYVRYSAWHLLDHTWEIEDRILTPP